jgi:uncharacterized membrane protein
VTKWGLQISAVAVLLMTVLYFWAAAGVGPVVQFSFVELAYADARPTGSAALTLLGLLPFLAAILALLFAGLQRVEPLRANLARGKRGFLIAWAGTQLLLLALAWMLATDLRAEAQGSTTDIGWLGAMAIGCGILFLVADSLPKTRRNFLFGVRTPWTLSSDLSWERTHRLAGRLFMLVALAGLVSALTLRSQALVYTFILPAVAAALACVIYSYVIWRRDAQRFSGEIEDE